MRKLIVASLLALASVCSAQTNSISLAQTHVAGVNLQTGTSYTVLSTDRSKLVSMSNASPVAVTLPQATGSFTTGFMFWIQNIGAGTATITPITSTIDGQSSLALTQYQGAWVVSNGTNWYTDRGVGSSGGGSGTVTSIATTGPITGGTITTTGTIGINDAAADGSTKGAASFTASDFNASSGLISLDYTNGQAADASHKGFLTSTDWNTFNGKQAAIAGNALSAHNFANSINSAGTISGAQPAIGDLQSIAADAVPQNATGSSAAPTAVAIPNCANDNAHALIYSTSSHAWSCQAITGSGIGGGAVTLETNGVNNGSQTVLNLKNGHGVSVTDGGSGDVTISAAFAWGGDGSDSSLTFDGTTTILGIVPTGMSALTLTSVAAGTGVYQGTIGGANNAYTGLTIVVTGFGTAANNGTFTCLFSTSTSITLANFNSAAETHAGTATPSQSSYVLTRDIFATDLTVNANVFVKAANYRIFGTGTLTVNGVIENDGGGGGAGGTVGNSLTGGAAGATGQCTTSTAGTSGSMPVTVPGAFGISNPSAGAGGNGGTTTGTQGAAGSSLTGGVNPVVSGGSNGSTGASGGLGGTGTSGAGGAVRTGGTATGIPTAINNTGRAPSSSLPSFLTEGGAASKFINKNGYSGGPSGGSGGGGDTTNSGAGGGGAGGPGGYGGFVYIAFPVITVGASGRISSNGGDGGPGGNGGTRNTGNVGGGGGGGGGTGATGGVMWLIYQSLTNSGTISVTAGNHGAAGAKGSPNGTGTNNATAGAIGVDGVAGVIIQIQN